MPSPRRAQRPSSNLAPLQYVISRSPIARPKAISWRSGKQRVNSTTKHPYRGQHTPCQFPNSETTVNRQLMSLAAALQTPEGTARLRRPLPPQFAAYRLHRTKSALPRRIWCSRGAKMTNIRGGDLSNPAVLKSLSRIRTAKLRLDRPTSCQSLEADLLSQIALCDVLLDEIQSVACSLKLARAVPGEPMPGRNRARLRYRSSKHDGQRRRAAQRCCVPSKFRSVAT